MLRLRTKIEAANISYHLTESHIKAAGSQRRWDVINLIESGPKNPGLMALGMEALVAIYGQAPFHIFLIRAIFFNSTRP